MSRSSLFSKNLLPLKGQILFGNGNLGGDRAKRAKGKSEGIPLNFGFGKGLSTSIRAARAIAEKSGLGGIFGNAIVKAFHIRFESDDASEKLGRRNKSQRGGKFCDSGLTMRKEVVHAVTLYPHPSASSLFSKNLLRMPKKFSRFRLTPARVPSLSRVKAEAVPR